MEAIYARQSLDIKDSLSISTQIEFCKKKCMEADDPIVYQDKGYSGKNVNRPAFRQLIEDIHNGKINRVIIYKLDRLSRSVIDFSGLWNTFDNHKVDICCATQDFDTSTPMGKAMIFIIMIFAQMERETIAERVKDNYYSRIKEGRWPGGPAPYGFDNSSMVDEKGRSVPTLLVNNNMDIMKMIFERYAYTDISLGKLALELNNDKIHCMRRESWNNVSLAKLMRNPAYVQANYDIYYYFSTMGIKIINPVDDFLGIKAIVLVGKRGTLLGGSREYKSYENMVMAIANWNGVVSTETWLSANLKLDTNKQIGNSGKSTITWLTGILKCGLCEKAFRTIKTSEKMARKIYCTGRSVAKNNCTNTTPLRIDEIEYYVQIELEKVIASCEGETFAVVPRLSNTDKIELFKIEEQIENVLAKIRNGQANDVLMTYLNRDIETLNTRKKEISEHMHVQQTKPVVVDQIVFNKMTLQQKHVVAEQYIKRVLVAGNNIDIEWRV